VVLNISRWTPTCLPRAHVRSLPLEPHLNLDLSRKTDPSLADLRPPAKYIASRCKLKLFLPSNAPQTSANRLPRCRTAQRSILIWTATVLYGFHRALDPNDDFLHEVRIVLVIGSEALFA